ncbi:hypothetical protein JCM10908_003003 [Rhodotorula pacifica]|uniref:uncharacterized protein n=1 Tax=Rhodotorula pacifica TaxID=1495444 RepID=UPI00317D40E1
MASSLKPPISSSTTGAPSTGYTGGGLARTITSNDLQPTESIVARRRGEATLRERDTIAERSLRRVSLEAGTARPAGETTDDEEEKPRLNDEGDDADKGAPLEEWTFPDGGFKAWSVILTG